MVSCLHRSVDLALDMCNNLALGLWSLKKNHPLSGSFKGVFHAGGAQKLNCSRTEALTKTVQSKRTFQVLNYTELFGGVCKKSLPFSHIKEMLLKMGSRVPVLPLTLSRCQAPTEHRGSGKGPETEVKVALNKPGLQEKCFPRAANGKDWISPSWLLGLVPFFHNHQIFFLISFSSAPPSCQSDHSSNPNTFSWTPTSKHPHKPLHLSLSIFHSHGS